MDLVLAILAAYVLGGAIWPQIVRGRRLFLLGWAALVAAMVLGAVPWGPFRFVAHLVEVAAFVVLTLAAAGASPPRFWREFKESFRQGDP